MEEQADIGSPHPHSDNQTLWASQCDKVKKYKKFLPKQTNKQTPESSL